MYVSDECLNDDIIYPTDQDRKTMSKQLARQILSHDDVYYAECGGQD